MQVSTNDICPIAQALETFSYRLTWCFSKLARRCWFTALMFPFPKSLRYAEHTVTSTQRLSCVSVRRTQGLVSQCDTQFAQI